MKCPACGPDKDYDVLYNCNDCQQSFCEEHIQSHTHQSQQQGEYVPMGKFSINLSDLVETARQAQRAAYAQREPTEEDYERFLRKNPQVLTTGRESTDLLVGILLIAFVFGFRPLLDGRETWQFVFVLTIIISPAFILHELAHKYLAIYYGKFARFTMVRQMAFFSFLAGILGIPIAAPGATMILSRSDDQESGIFAAGGPATNFVLALISLGLAFIIPDIYISSIDHDLAWVFYLSAYINGILGLFNLIPLGNLDGKKILGWNSFVWLTLVLINIPMVYLSFPELGLL